LEESVDYKSIKAPIGIILMLALIFIPLGIQAEPPTREWTFMLFMAADNNLEGGTEVDINELEQYGSTDKIAYVAQIDRNGNYSGNSEFKWSGSKRFYITQDRDKKKVNSKELQDLGEVDMASPEALTDFVSWTKKNYPAKKYALILWNHGTGWKEIQPSVMEYVAPPPNLSEGMTNALENISYNISYDDTSRSSMDIPTLRETMAEVKNILGQPVDLLGFDACLMQMAEVGWAVSPFARYQVASPDLEPERGWAYNYISGALNKRPQMTPFELGRLIVQTYKKSYSGGSQGNTAVVLSLLDLKQANKFKQSIQAFSLAIRKNISDIDKIEKCRDEALKYSYSDYIDLPHFLYLLTKTSVSSDTKKAAYHLYKTIIGEKKKGGLVAYLAKNGEKFRDSRGLSVFFPTRQGFKTYMNRYKRLSFCRETEWFETLREFATPNIPYMRIENVVLLDKNNDGRIAAGEEVTMHLTIRNLGRKALKTARLNCKTNSELLNKQVFSTTLNKLPGPGKTVTIPVLKFQVKEDAPIHSDITLNIALKGEKIPVSSSRTTFYVKEAFASTGHALMVITDAFSPAGPTMNQMLNDANVKFDTWDRVMDGDLTPDVLKRYLDGWVMVVVQDSTPQQALNESEIKALNGFLNSGGRLVLNGQDLAFLLRDTNFLKDKCKASFIQDDVNVHVVSGINGFADNQTFQIFGGDGANNQKWPDEIDVLPGGQAIFKYEEKARDIADKSSMVGPSHKPMSRSKGIKSSGTSAVKVIDGYRLLMFTFGIEAINNKSQRKQMMKEILKVMVPGANQELLNLARTAANHAPDFNKSEEEILAQTDLLLKIESRLLKQIKRDLENNPENAQSLLRQINRMPEQQRNAVKNLEKNIQTLLEFDRQHGTLRQR
jgi:hypothetical protein